MQRHVWKRLLARPVWVLSGGVGVLLLLGFALLFYSVWRHEIQLRPIELHMRYIADIDTVNNELWSLGGRHAAPGHPPVDPSRLYRVRRQLDDLVRVGRHLHPETPERLARAERRIQGFDGTVSAPLDEALDAIRDTLAAELGSHGELMAEIRTRVQRELRITSGILLGLLLFTLPLSVLVRKRIMAPLDNLASLMMLLSRHDYTSATVNDVDPLLRPLFVNYNRMVSRLVTLEQEHHRREETLTESVRRATRLLLQQHRRLAQAERLGAVGEVTASVAHELRNPLTAMHMALQNLRGDLANPDHVERVDMVIEEINRLSRQLNLLLDSARQAPEPVTRVDMAEVVGDLLTLVRYQLSEHISLEADVPEGSGCRLPVAQLRQCILNLVLNAGQMLDENPGRIVVRARMVNTRMLLTVEDDGPGFPEEILATGARVFGSLRAGGTGLGLVMVRRFVSDHGGQMRLENHEPHGARVILDIPCGSESDG
jgi:nitrogen fixation/metabolism regulation signal transduction histidine kinase